MRESYLLYRFGRVPNVSFFLARPLSSFFALSALFCLLMAHPGVRRLVSLLWVIERARRAERSEPMGVSWETARA